MEKLYAAGHGMFFEILFLFRNCYELYDTIPFPVGTAMRAYVMDMYAVRKLHTYVIGHGKVMV